MGFTDFCDVVLGDFVKVIEWTLALIIKEILWEKNLKNWSEVAVKIEKSRQKNYRLIFGH